MSKADLFENASRDRSPLGDERMERLLTEFFRHEMPAGLRDGSVPSQMRAPLSRHGSSHHVTAQQLGESRPRALRASVVGLAAVVTALLSVIALVQSASTSRDTASQILASRVDNSRALAAKGGTNRTEHVRAAPSSGAGRPEYSLTERDDAPDSVRADDSRGPIERPLKRRITSVSVTDPETGDRVEVEIPELSIEIFPIEKQLERKPAENPSAAPKK